MTPEQVQNLTQKCIKLFTKEEMDLLITLLADRDRWKREALAARKRLNADGSGIRGCGTAEIMDYARHRAANTPAQQEGTNAN